MELVLGPWDIVEEWMWPTLRLKSLETLDLRDLDYDLLRTEFDTKFVQGPTEGM